jgi:hypothetical protein
VRSTSVRSKWQGDHRVGGVADKEAYTVRTINFFFPAAVLCSSLSQFLCRKGLWFAFYMCLFSFCPQATDVGKTHFYPGYCTTATIGVRYPTVAEDFYSSFCSQTGSGAHPASCTMGTGDPFPGGKARPGRDADHSPPSCAEVKNEQEPYLLSPHAPPWRVAGSLYLLLHSCWTISLSKDYRETF